MLPVKSKGCLGTWLLQKIERKHRQEALLVATLANVKVFFLIDLFLNIFIPLFSYNTHSSCPCHQPKLKVAQSTCKQIILAVDEVRRQAPRGPGYFPFGGRLGVLDFYCSQCVPMKLSLFCNKFSMGLKHFPQVPKVIPNMFPIALHFTPYPLP